MSTRQSQRVASFLFILSAALTMPPAAAAIIERTPVRHRSLENGLEVVWEEDHRQPLVAIEARVQGGVRGEGPYVGTGITHFIEHMLFKGTPSRPPGTIEQEVRRYGGTINAFTSLDTTGVTLFVESRYLREALTMLADILQHALFDPSEFEKERAVILSEIQMNLDDPERRLHQVFWQRHVLVHPYRHPILGHRTLLEGLTVEELTAFYRAQYQPQHITLAAVGDLDGTAFPELVHDLFGSWPRGRVDPAQHLVPQEPPAASLKDVSLELPLQAAYVMLGFSSTRLSDPDVYPLDVLANILGQGRSSRLYEQLVRQRRLVDAIQAWNYTPFDPGVFAVQFRTSPDRMEAAIAAVLEILEQVQREGVTEAEVRKTKRQVIAEYHFARQTTEARAGDLANALAATGDPQFSQQYVNGIDRVTASQVQQAAQRYGARSRMTVASLRPPVPPAQDTEASSGVSGMTVTKEALDNDAVVLVGADHRLPIAALIVAFRGGVRVETEASQGLSNLVARLLTKGTRRKSASEIAARIEGMGGALEPFSGRDGFGLSLQLLSEDVAEGVALLHELVTEATFPEAELEIQRGLILNELKAQEDEIFEVGSRALRQTLFIEHPYRFHPLGTKETVQALTRSDCVEFAKRWMLPLNLVLSVVGDVEPEAVLASLRRSFGQLPRRESAWPDRVSAESLTEVRETSITLPKEQALVILGFRGGERTAPDRYALDVLSAIFSGMAGRLFQAVREQQGLAYTLGAAHVPGWDPGEIFFYAATKPEFHVEVLEALQEQIRLVVGEGLADAEVEQAKRYLIGQHRMELQSFVGMARRVALDELYGVGYDAWTRDEEALNAVTVASVKVAAGRYLTLPHRAQVLVTPDGPTTWYSPPPGGDQHD